MMPTVARESYVAIHANKSDIKNLTLKKETTFYPAILVQNLNQRRAK